MKKILILVLLILNTLQAAVTTLTSGTSVNASVNYNEEKHYKITVPAGKKLKSVLNDLVKDADVYVRIGSLPTGSEYDCRSANGGITTDQCSITLSNCGCVFTD